MARHLTERQCELVATVLRQRRRNARKGSADQRLPAEAPRLLLEALPTIVSVADLEASEEGERRRRRQAAATTRHGQLAVRQLRKAKGAAKRAAKQLEGIHPPVELAHWHGLAVAAARRLAAELESEMLAPPRRRGIAPDIFRQVLAKHLARWWLAHDGWRPTRSDKGAFVGVLRAILTHLGEPAPRAFENQALINAIGRGADALRLDQLVQAELQRQMRRVPDGNAQEGQSPGFDADGFLRGIVAKGRAEPAPPPDADAFLRELGLENRTMG